MLKKYGKLIILFILLIITTEITISFNKKIDDKLSTEEVTNTVEQLRAQLEKSTAVADGMNPYRDFWEYELDYFYKNYPEKEVKLFLDIDKEEWNNAFLTLKKKITTEYVDDVTFMSEVSSTIREFIPINYLQDIFDTSYENGYFRSVMMLMQDDQENAKNNT
ncbi:MAG: hypothetical protein PUC65_06080 [Clostridiales bacterium]|nr:hypothetical protein [Clostridiales bacterium]